MKLYHKIGEGGEDSAAVRKFLVENDLNVHVDFQNISYDAARSELFEATGAENAPVLLVPGLEPIRGRVAILDYFKREFLRMRD